MRPSSPGTLGVAVSNAVPELKAHAGLVTIGARGEGVLERLGRSLEKRSRTRLRLRHDDAAGLRIVHLLEVDEETGRVDDGDGHVPLVLARFDDRGRGRCLGEV